MILFGACGLGFGAWETKVAVDNPAPTTVECSAGLIDAQGAGRWLEIRGCEFDLEEAVEVFDGKGTETIYVPLRTADGDPAGLVASRDAEVIELVESLSPSLSDEDAMPMVGDDEVLRAALASRRDGMSIR